MTSIKQPFQVIGLMSGTSLDGLDVAYISFIESNKIEFELLNCETIPYTLEWRKKLSQAFHSTEQELSKLDSEYGNWLGSVILHFIAKNKLKPDLIASHGHTVFHVPQKGYTLQIGSGSKIRDITQLPVINNFRAQDVSLGGQGAPLVPIGDELLFSEYDFCLNLGGFSNVSWESKGKRLACDIGVCNILMNEICKRISLEYDKDGMIAKEGHINNYLLDKWNSLEYYKLTAPKSLGREWFETHFMKDIQTDTYHVKDLLATALHHIVFQIHKFLFSVIQNQNSKKDYHTVLVTGGGAHNSFMMEKFHECGGSKMAFIIPGIKIIDFKEAMVFALLGYLRWHKKINVLATVTGAKRDHSSGDIYS